MEKIDPGLVVIGEADSDVLDYYRGYVHICQNTAKDIAFQCEAGYVHVYAENPYAIDGLDDLGRRSFMGLSYVGSLRTKE